MMNKGEKTLYTLSVTTLVCKTSIISELKDVEDKIVPWSYGRSWDDAGRLMGSMRQDLKQRIQWPIWAQLQEDMHVPE